MILIDLVETLKKINQVIDDMEKTGKHNPKIQGLRKSIKIIMSMPEIERNDSNIIKQCNKLEDYVNELYYHRENSISHQERNAIVEKIDSIRKELNVVER
jgi:uncharacterized protein YoxC